MRLGKLAIVLTILIVFPACTKKSKDTGNTTSTDEENTGTLALGSNELAAAYPEGLALTAFPTTIDSKPGEAAAGTLEVDASLADDVTDFSKHPKEILVESQKVLEGDVDSCFDADVLAGLNAPAGNSNDVCFGFDYGIVSGTMMGSADIGQINPAIASATDTADAKAKLQAIVTQANTSGESCMVGTARNMVSSAAGKVDSALKLFQGMFCQAKKGNLATALPAVGEEIDLISVFDEMPTGPNPATYKVATIKRLADKDERPVYQTTLSLTTTDQAQGEKPFSIQLVHSPSLEGNAIYDGVMWIASERTENAKTFHTVLNISYAKSGATFEDSKLKLDMRSANILDSFDPFFDDGTVNYNAGADTNGNYPGQANDFVSGISYFAFEVNPSNYAGKISFWTNPGGNYQEAARGFVFDSEQDVDGKISGCAYAGAYREGSIRMAAKEAAVLKPTGCYTPQLTNGACGAPGDNVGTQIWKQCFVQNDDGLYEVDTAKVTDTTAGFDIIEKASVTVPQVDFSDLESFEGVYTAE